MWIAIILIYCGGISLVSTLPNGFVQIHMRGVRGFIYFIPSGENIRIKVDTITGLIGPQEFAWQINQFPVNYDSEDPCSETIIGSLYSSDGDLTKTHGLLKVPSKDNNFFNPLIKLTGSESVLGRSLLLQNLKSNLTICATISNKAVTATAFAKFKTYISGIVIFRKAQDSDMTIFSDLFHRNDSVPPTSYQWSIISSNNTLNKCQDFTNMEKYKLCSLHKHATCHEKDLGGKHGNIIVGTGNRSQKQLYTDTNFPFEMISGSKILFLVINAGQTVLDCAQISIFRSKDVRARISSQGIKGYVRFQQKSPFDSTHITVELENLNGLASEWQIHDYPFKQQVEIDENLCKPENVGDCFHPFVKTFFLKNVTGGTNDEYQVGDLSGKFGSFENKNEISVIYEDLNLQLFGSHSIVGRSIVITTSIGTICSNIDYPKKVITAMATFYYPISGIIILRQDETDSASDVSIYGDLSYSDGSTKSRDLKWMITSKGLKYSNNSCPISDIAGCVPNNQQKCLSDDLTRKYDLITLESNKRATFFNISTDISLSGSDNIIGKFLLIFSSELEYDIICASITHQWPINAIVQNWLPIPVQGYIFFGQLSIFDQTTVSVNLKSLQYLADNYYVYEFPIDEDSSKSCDETVTGQLYNPFRIKPDSESFKNVSDDQYAIGNLSGKYNRLINLTALTASVFIDSNLPLIGPNSIIGRSVVLHKAENDARWICSNVEYNLYTYERNAFPIQTITSFNNSKVNGYIKMKQLTFVDGSYSDTTIIVALHPKEERREKVQWFIGEGLLQGSDVTSDCSQVTQIYNPFRVNTENISYVNCNHHNSLRCQVGDLTAKIGSITLDHQILTDSFLPLTGKFSVIGHPLVLRNDQEILACGEIRLNKII